MDDKLQRRIFALGRLDGKYGITVQHPFKLAEDFCALLDSNKFDEAFSWVIVNNRYDLLKSLLVNPKIPLQKTLYLLDLMVKYGRSEMVKLLIESDRMDLTRNLYSIVVSTIKKGKAEIVKIFLDNPRIILENSSGFLTLFELAMMRPCFKREIITMLLKDPRVDPSHDRYYSLTSSIDDHSLNQVEFVLRHKSFDLQKLKAFLDIRNVGERTATIGLRTFVEEITAEDAELVETAKLVEDAKLIENAKLVADVAEINEKPIEQDTKSTENHDIISLGLQNVVQQAISKMNISKEMEMAFIMGIGVGFGLAK